MAETVPTEKNIDYALLDRCLAAAIACGDIVNLRFLFLPASPFRRDSSEDISMSKYAYLLAEEESDALEAALRLVQQAEISRQVREQLEKKGPPQLPWELLQALADNALRLGKYTAASQAYELLRTRRRMQEIFLDQADAALDRGAYAEGARGYKIAAGLQYDYAAFPEALPAVLNYQEKAVTLHGKYPVVLEGETLSDDRALCRSSLLFLLQGADFIQRLENRDDESLIQFTAEMIRCLDPAWDRFVPAFQEACRLISPFAELFSRINSYTQEALEVLLEEIFSDEEKETLRGISQFFAPGIAEGSAWQLVMRTLAYYHPGAVSFVRRQRLSASEEILIPALPDTSRLAQQLGLFPL
ncbi:MAG TPA: hypothetical protein PLQ42_10590 [Candidatus Hydrogenedentes bacterium]|jgi:hypothetical protein|nr:MAG: hypothetical protein BWY07_02021 [Candidatus Hydrogenedentes bacterium ADurb.Bin170]HNZ49469.1 hypothetical protein [Candidatus Hydrogenedentota bacterium]HOD96012.1 hypothetical protein [Candidatus Hydrogenedentota bacterium]HOR51517.1 hypothetical protein [Candidatus Hydrogenedentota bacterium]HPK24280.1 hypothetical protein [Candidatus Hydrogenedentota bacterium]